MVGGEDDDGVVPGRGGIEGTQDGAEAGVVELMELGVVVELAEPDVGVVRIHHPGDAVLHHLRHPPLVDLGFGGQVVVEVRREIGEPPLELEGEIRQVLGPTPVLLGQQVAGPGHVVGVALGVPRLIDGKPHDVVRVDQPDTEEPRLVDLGPVPDPGRAVLGDRLVELGAGAGEAPPGHVVPGPVTEAVGLHVRGGGGFQVPFALERGVVALASQQVAEGDGVVGELGVLATTRVLGHPVFGHVLAGEQGGSAGGARRGVGVVVGELQPTVDQALPVRERVAIGEPVPLAFLIRDDQEDVRLRCLARARLGHRFRPPAQWWAASEAAHSQPMSRLSKRAKNGSASKGWPLVATRTRGWLDMRPV